MHFGMQVGCSDADPTEMLCVFLACRPTTMYMRLRDVPSSLLMQTQVVIWLFHQQKLSASVSDEAEASG